MIGKQNIFGGNHVWMRPGNTRALIRKSSTRCSANHLSQWPTSATPLGKHQLHPHLPASLLSPLPTPSAPSLLLQSGPGRGGGGRAKTEKMATRVFLSGGLLRQGRARAWSAIFCCLLHRGLTGTFSRALLITSKRFHATISCNDFMQRFQTYSGYQELVAIKHDAF